MTPYYSLTWMYTQLYNSSKLLCWLKNSTSVIMNKFSKQIKLNLFFSRGKKIDYDDQFISNKSRRNIEKVTGYKYLGVWIFSTLEIGANVGNFLISLRLWWSTCSQLHRTLFITVIHQHWYLCLMGWKGWVLYIRWLLYCVLPTSYHCCLLMWVLIIYVQIMHYFQLFLVTVHLQLSPH